MTVYFHMDDVAIALPEGAIDMTTNFLEWKIDGDAVQLTIQRDTKPNRLSPAKLLHATRAEYERRFPLFQAETPPAMAIEFDHAVAAFTWKKEHQAVYQVQAFVELGSRVMVLTATGRTKHRALIADLMQKATESLTIRP
ncbi:MAG: DcrB-related protein [Myxococcales bacterium]|nr:DcrB-related protein [Myxococcales bacterium]